MILRKEKLNKVYWVSNLDSNESFQTYAISLQQINTEFIFQSIIL